MDELMLTPKNWERFQHYRDRCPPWIKLHRDLLNNRAFMCLPLASKALAPLLWLLASEQKNGIFKGDVQELAFRLRIDEADIIKGIKPLFDNGFFLDASTMLAPCLQHAIPETERETETEREGEECAQVSKIKADKKKPEQKTNKQKNNSAARASPSERATRIPDDWQPDYKTAKEILPDWSEHEITEEAKNFIDHWKSKPGAGGKKLDWNATWRVWLRNEKKRFGNRMIKKTDKNKSEIDAWLEGHGG